MATKEQRREWAYAWREKNPERWRQILNDAQVRQRGMDPRVLEELIELQGGACIICEDVPKPRTRGDNPVRSLHIDHDHSCCSGKKLCGKCNRGLICTRCNMVIGQIESNPGLLDKILAYLKDPPLQRYS